MTVEVDDGVAEALKAWAAKEMRPEGNAAAIAIAAFLQAQEYTVELHPRYRVRRDAE